MLLLILIQIPLAAVLYRPARADTPPPQLTLDDVNVKRDGIVTFSTLFQGPDTRADFPQPRFLVDQTDDKSFRLCIDTDSIQQLRFNAFTFTAYLADAKSSPQKVFKFQVTGNPSGSFRDSPVRVSFHVKSAAAASAGIIQMLPVYNATKTDLLLVDDEKEPEYVSTDKTPIQISLANAPDSLAIAITDVSVTQGCPKCWKHIISTVTDKAPLNIETGTKANLPIELNANSVPALLHGALVIRPDIPHDTLSFTVTYHTVPGGADRKQTIPYKVRFGPGILGLSLAVCCGIGLGLAAKYLLTDSVGKKGERALHAVLTALVLGIIAEFIGVMMTSYGDSKLIVFDLDIDPRQVFPAFILAVLVSGGSAVIAWMKGLFGKQQS
jgi:hypothetical protein